MKIGICKGSLWATRKDKNLQGLKLLIIETSDPLTMEKETIVAADIIGSGIGDQVLVTTGSSARMSVGNNETSIDAAVIGIIDSVDIEDT